MISSVISISTHKMTSREKKVTSYFFKTYGFKFMEKQGN